MKVKLFWKNSNPTTAKVDENVRDFENEINALLSESPRINIIEIRQSSNGDAFGSWFVSVWYELSDAKPGADVEHRS